MRYERPVRYWDGREWYLGVLRSVLADFPGHDAVFLIRDILTKEDKVIHSKNTNFMV
jgi:hypothetical protein